MIEFIVVIIFFVSVGGVIAILYKKMPILVTLPQNGSIGFKKHRFISDIENKIREAHVYLFVKQVLLHRTLSWIKIMTLKVESKIDTLLHRIRKKAQEADKNLNK